jgi:hypothetical protein
MQVTVREVAFRMTPSQQSDHCIISNRHGLQPSPSAAQNSHARTNACISVLFKVATPISDALLEREKSLSFPQQFLFCAANVAAVMESSYVR